MAVMQFMMWVPFSKAQRINMNTCFYLNLDAFALMEGPAEKFIKTGSALFLKCTFHKSSGNPDFVFW